jgi:hypothetical protein
MASPFVACTVASRGFLAHARVLIDSFFEHHPGGRFTLLIPDDPAGERAVDERVEVLRPLDIGVDEAELHRMALAYSIKELSCAMKSRLLRHLVARGETAVLLDGDVCVYGDLSPIAEIAEREGLVLTPHAVKPHATPDRFPPMLGHAPRMLNALGAEQMWILSGTFNTGIVAVTRDAVPFLDWWSERTARYCLIEPVRGLFQEQGWTALVPSLFPCHILREPGWNVSGFHLHDDDVVWQGARPTIAGAPLRCFHFITYDPSQPDQLTSHPQIRGVWPPPRERPGALRVCDDYGARLRAAGYEAAMADRSPYDTLPDGTPVDLQMRAAYGEALLEHEAGRAPKPPNPFDDGHCERFLAWLREPVEGPPGGAPVPRYLLAIHTRLAWVWGSFKEVPGADAERYLAWLPDAVRAGDLDVPEQWLPEPAPPEIDPYAAHLEERCRELETHRDRLEAHRDGLVAHRDQLEARCRELTREVDVFRSSRSWRLTLPLRSAVRVARRRLPSPR